MPSTPPPTESAEPKEVETRDISGDSEESHLIASSQVLQVRTSDPAEQQLGTDEVQSDSIETETQPAHNTPSAAEEAVFSRSPVGFFQERPAQTIEAAPKVLRHWTRRDVLLFGAGAIAALAGAGSLLPQATLERLGVAHGNKPWPRKEWLLNKALRIDDDVADALYSQNRLVPTYTKSQITSLKNNYNGATPAPGYIPEWQLTLDDLASGLSVSLNIRNLLTRFQVHEQITRLVCVEAGAQSRGGPV